MSSHFNHTHDLISFSKKFNNVKSEIVQYCISHPHALQNTHFIRALLHDSDDSYTLSRSQLRLYKIKNDIILRWKHCLSASTLTTSDIFTLCS